MGPWGHMAGAMAAMVVFLVSRLSFRQAQLADVLEP